MQQEKTLGLKVRCTAKLHTGERVEFTGVFKPPASSQECAAIMRRLADPGNRNALEEYLQEFFLHFEDMPGDDGMVPYSSEARAELFNNEAYVLAIGEAGLVAIRRFTAGLKSHSRKSKRKGGKGK